MSNTSSKTSIDNEISDLPQLIELYKENHIPMIQLNELIEPHFDMEHILEACKEIYTGNNMVRAEYDEKKPPQAMVNFQDMVFKCIIL
jgi:hypothetical protein